MPAVRDLLEAYKGVVLEHPLLERAFDRVRLGIAPGMPPQIVLLLGPTGVGKTTLLHALKRRLGRPEAPIVRATCVPVSGPRGFDFGKTHWGLLAEAVGDPFSDDHLSPDVARDRLRTGRVRRDGPATRDQYRLGVLHMLRERGAQAVILDEAQHMTRTPAARSQADQLDVVKDCVDRTGIPHVLAGTYELSVMVAPGDQLGRRTIVVHFPPYGPSGDADRDAFQRIFGQLVAALPIADRRGSWAALSTRLPDVYLGCCGCVGILKDWLQHALQFALETDLQSVDWSVMETCRWSDEVLFKIADEIRAYRELTSHTRQDIEVSLGICPASPAPATQPRSSARSKPGKRSPHRDPVGLPSERQAS